MNENADITNNDELRDYLFTALTAGDMEQFTRLCAQNRKAIKRNFHSWQRLPVEIREHKEKVKIYAQRLVSLAHHFAKNGDISLLEALDSTRPGKNSGIKSPPHGTNRLIYSDDAGRTLSPATLKEYTWKLPPEQRYKVTEQAKQELAAGRKAFSAGDRQQALQLYEKTVAMAPLWPAPLFELANSYLLMGDNRQALAIYRRTEELAPRGFLSLKTAIHTLMKEEQGTLPPGTFLIYRQLETIQDRETLKDLIAHLLQEAPGFAPAWQMQGEMAKTDEEKFTCILKGLTCDPDQETGGKLLIDQAALLHSQGQQEDAIAILGKLALDPATTIGNEHLAMMMLAEWFGYTGQEY